MVLDVLDNPKVRNKPDNLPWGNSWMKWVGVSNVSTEAIDARLGLHHHGKLSADRTSAADVGIHGVSYRTIWARLFLELQGDEFPIIVSHVGIDGVGSGDYGERLLDDYRDADCRNKLGATEKGSVSTWFGEAVQEVDKAIVDGSAGFCGKYFWVRLAMSSALSGWAAKVSGKEAWAP